MLRRIALRTACALALAMGAGNSALAQPDLPPDAARDASHWTAVTMATDGSWGVATDLWINRAIARAIHDCRTMSQASIGCGAYYTTIQGGWSLGLRCGDQSILVADHDLAEAERSALNREMDLRQHYAPGMPPCLRVLTVDPRGAIVVPDVRMGDAAPAAAFDHDPRGNARSLNIGDIPIWRTVTLGTYRDVNMLLEALDSLNCGLDEPPHAVRARTASRAARHTMPCTLGDQAGEIIARPAFNLSKTSTQVNLVVLSVAELGFGDEGASVADAHARARQLGLELCAAEVGPQLRLQYLDQPLGEFLRIAMEPIATYGGDLVDLTIANGGASLSLIGGDARPDQMTHPHARFVFVRPTRIAQPTLP